MITDTGPEAESYCASLQAGTLDKVRVIAPWIPADSHGDIVDVGTGTGALAFPLAAMFPHRRLTGVDADPGMLAVARRWRPRGSNLEFRLGSAQQPQSAGAASVIFSSVLHEVYSYGGRSLSMVASALRAAYASMLPGGRVIVRDFVRPADARRRVVLRHRLPDMVPGHDFLTFSMQFAGRVALDGAWPEGSEMCYATDLAGAYEFIARKDFHRLWSRELLEVYTFWDLGEAKNLLRAAGFRIVHEELIQSDWVLKASVFGNIRLLDAETGALIAFPPRQCLLVGEKPPCDRTTRREFGGRDRRVEGGVLL